MLLLEVVEVVGENCFAADLSGPLLADCIREVVEVELLLPPIRDIIEEIPARLIMDVVDEVCEGGGVIFCASGFCCCCCCCCADDD